MGSPHPHSKKGMRRDYKCKVCENHYAMEWAKDNCQRKCEDRLKNGNT